MSDNLNSKELEIQINHTKECIKKLKEKLVEHEIAIKATEAKLRELCGSAFRHDQGKLRQLKQEHGRAVQREADAKAIVVVWKEQPYCNPKDLRVVRKVTTKRIYISKYGEKDTTYFDKDGTNRAYDGVIDIQATFGDDYENILS